jgi:membrane associated rhomboid family serine protease
MTSTSGGGGVAFMAHVAGFLFGMAGVFVFRKGERTEQYWA